MKKNIQKAAAGETKWGMLLRTSGFHLPVQESVLAASPKEVIRNCSTRSFSTPQGVFLTLMKGTQSKSTSSDLRKRVGMASYRTPSKSRFIKFGLSHALKVAA